MVGPAVLKEIDACRLPPDQSNQLTLTTPARNLLAAYMHARKQFSALSIGTVVVGGLCYAGMLATRSRMVHARTSRG